YLVADGPYRVSESRDQGLAHIEVSVVEVQTKLAVTWKRCGLVASIEGIQSQSEKANTQQNDRGASIDRIQNAEHHHRNPHSQPYAA
ncbi:MAG: hypothetical protein PVG54_06180, partial [Anaerolineae bacterium]